MPASGGGAGSSAAGTPLAAASARNSSAADHMGSGGSGGAEGLSSHNPGQNPQHRFPLLPSSSANSGTSTSKFSSEAKFHPTGKDELTQSRTDQSNAPSGKNASKSTISSNNRGERRGSLNSGDSLTRKHTQARPAPAVTSQYLMGAASSQPFDVNDALFATTTTNALVSVPSRASLVAGPKWHPFWLTYRDNEMELEYEKFMLEKQLRVWRRTIFLVFAAATLLYGYVMIRSPKDGEVWESSFSDEAKGSVTVDNIDSVCPAGWYCMQCNPDFICNKYHLSWDLGFWIGSIFSPCFIVIMASYRLRLTQLAALQNLLSVLFIMAYAGLGLIIRYRVVEPNTPVFQTALLSIMLIFVSYLFMRVRFIYTASSLLVIFVVFTATYGADLTREPRYAPSSVKTFIISVLALLVTVVVVCFNTYDSEVFSRSQFMAAYMLQKTNAKLTNQLKVLQKSYGKKVADLDSPLEKSVMLLRSMMADPTNSPSHLMSLNQIVVLLGSSNLLAPDLESQVAQLDNEQEKWLFSEISPRRKGTSGRARTRRRSITADVSAKIDTPLVEASTASIFGSRSLVPEKPGQGGDSGSRATSASIVNTSGQLLSTHESAPGLVLANESQSSVSSGKLSTHRYTVGGRGSGPVGVAASMGAVDEAARTQNILPVMAYSTSVLPNRQSGSNATSESVVAMPLEPISAFNPSPEVMAMLQRSLDYNWPVFEFAELCNGQPLTTLSYYLFKKADLFNIMNIPFDLFRNFILAIESGYKSDLPYHNSTHASDVLHCTNHFMFANDVVSHVVGDFDILSIYVAAIIHDYDHPGLNNSFLINTYDSKAMLYNDRSVLENHHLASAFRVMNLPENNFLVNLSKNDYRSVREAVIDMVLATDLSQHFPLISLFRSKVQGNFQPLELRDDRHLLWKILIKCADVSNPSKSYGLYEKWVRVILQEFFLQGDLEKEMGLPVSPFMDRESLNVPSSQSGFIEFVVFPLFEAFDVFATIPSIMNDLTKNRDFWQRLKAQGITSTMPLSGPLGSTNSVGGHSPPGPLSKDHSQSQSQPPVIATAVLSPSPVTGNSPAVAPSVTTDESEARPPAAAAVSMELQAQPAPSTPSLHGQNQPHLQQQQFHPSPTPSHRSKHMSTSISQTHNQSQVIQQLQSMALQRELASQSHSHSLPHLQQQQHSQAQHQQQVGSSSANVVLPSPDRGDGPPPPEYSARRTE